ncbi:MAG: hypothetical protein ACREME_03785, partial [Gemmatimonadales bacterium]
SGLARWLLDPLSVTGSYVSGGSRSELSRASASSYALNVDYTLLPRPATIRVAGAALRLNPTAIRLRSGLAGSDAERFTYTVPIPRPGDTLPPVVSQVRLWRSAAGIELVPLTGVRFGVDAGTTRDLRDYGDSTTIGRLIGQGSGSFLGQNIGVETQRSLSTSLNLTPRLAAWIRPRAALTSSFGFTRDPNARQPVRTIGDSAGEFRIPAAYSNARRFEAGTQLDPGRLAGAVFGDSSSVAGWLGRITSLDVSYNRQRASRINRAGDLPPLGYQLALGGLDDFRRVDGLLAASATQNATLTAGATAVFGWGLRGNASYRRTRGIVWSLRGDQQLPIRSYTRDWPNGTLTWSLTPSRRWIGRVLSSLTAQLIYRRTETENQQPTFGSTTNVSISRLSERSLSPSLTLTWAGGIFTSLDASRSRSERLTAGNLFRTSREQQNATVTFAFRLPSALGGGGRWPANIRTTARYSVVGNTTCLRAAGQADCVPYVDSRQVQAQLTMDTDLPSNMSAGLQLAYLLTEERQTNRKVAQLVITAFVQLATSVGQIR